MINFRTPNGWMLAASTSAWGVTGIQLGFPARIVMAPSANSSGSRATYCPIVAVYVMAPIRS